MTSWLVAPLEEPHSSIAFTTFQPSMTWDPECSQFRSIYPPVGTLLTEQITTLVQMLVETLE